MSKSGKPEQIGEEDFFRMSQPFQIWLQKKKKKQFTDLDTKKQKKMFKKFVKKWNRRKLEDIFYDTVHLVTKYGHLLHAKHSWGIKIDRDELDKINAVHEQTEAEKIDPHDLTATHTRAAEDSNHHGLGRGPLARAGDKQYDLEVEREHRERDRKAQRKAFARDREDLLDELVPKKVGKEAILDKKRVLNQKLNGPRDDDDEYGVAGEDALLGDDGRASFRALKQREEARERMIEERKAQQAAVAAERVREYERQEQEKLKLILQGGKKFK